MKVVTVVVIVQSMSGYFFVCMITFYPNKVFNEEKESQEVGLVEEANHLILVFEKIIKALIHFSPSPSVKSPMS